MGGYTGWVIGGLYQYPPSMLLEEDPRSNQRSGPRKAPAGSLEWVGCGVRTYPAAGRSFPTLRARSVQCLALPGNDLRMPPPGQRGEISPYFL